MSGHGHRFNPEKADKLLDPERKKVIDPLDVIKIMKLSSEDTVADLGAGNGYFTLPIAEKTDKIVYAVDIEPKMLQALQENAKSKGISNIKYIESGLENIPIQDHEIDKILIAFVTHEVPDRKKLYKEFKRLLKQEGNILILDWQKIKSSIGAPFQARISSEELNAELAAEDFQTEVIDLNENVYAIAVRNPKIYNENY